MESIKAYDRLHLISCFVISTEFWYCSTFSGFIIMSTISYLSEWKASARCFSCSVSLFRLDPLELPIRCDISLERKQDTYAVDYYRMEERYCCQQVLQQTHDFYVAVLSAVLSSFRYMCHTEKVKWPCLWVWTFREYNPTVIQTCRPTVTRPTALPCQQWFWMSQVHRGYKLQGSNYSCHI